MFTSIKPTDLCLIMKKHGSDKGMGWHNYTEKYFELFEPIKNQVKHVFELGLGTNNIDVPSNMGKDGVPGASLRGWKEYFLNATIFGADIDKRILFEEEKIKTFYVDQTNKISIKDMWQQIPHFFDIIIDDGLHQLQGNICFLENSLHKLHKNGIYIIEDIVISDMQKYYNTLSDLSNEHNFDFKIIPLYSQFNQHDNCIAIIEKNKNGLHSR